MKYTVNEIVAAAWYGEYFLQWDSCLHVQSTLQYKVKYSNNSGTCKDIYHKTRISKEAHPVLPSLELVPPERPERGGPCWLLKMRRMKNQRLRMKGILPWLGLLGLSYRYKRLLFCLGCSTRPGTKYEYIFLTVHYFHSVVPIAQQAGQAAVLVRLSLSMVFKCHGPPSPLQPTQPKWYLPFLSLGLFLSV